MEALAQGALCKRMRFVLAVLHTWDRHRSRPSDLRAPRGDLFHQSEQLFDPPLLHALADLAVRAVAVSDFTLAHWPRHLDIMGNLLGYLTVH
jgi:hypothetical protein